MRRLSRVRAGRWALCLLLLMPSLVLGEDPSVDPETGAIRLLFIGDSFMQPGFPTPYYVDDPRIDVTPIPSEIGILGTGSKRGGHSGSPIHMKQRDGLSSGAQDSLTEEEKTIVGNDYDSAGVPMGQKNHMNDG